MKIASLKMALEHELNYKNASDLTHNPNWGLKHELQRLPQVQPVIAYRMHE